MDALPESENYIELPEDAGLVKKLQKKYYEYLGRIMERQNNPERTCLQTSMMRDRYKARILDDLHHKGSVDLTWLASRLEKEENAAFDGSQFLRAAAVIRNYCQNQGFGLIGGTGL